MKEPMILSFEAAPSITASAPTNFLDSPTAIYSGLSCYWGPYSPNYGQGEGLGTASYGFGFD